MQIAGWLSPTLMGLAILIGIGAALIGNWWTVVAMALVLLSQTLVLRRRRQR